MLTHGNGKFVKHVLDQNVDVVLEVFAAGRRSETNKTADRWLACPCPVEGFSGGRNEK
jgi:hypothetical protein